MAATPRTFSDSNVSLAKNRLRTVDERKGDGNESQTVLRACEVLKAFRNPGEELVLADVVLARSGEKHGEGGGSRAC